MTDVFIKRSTKAKPHYAGLPLLHLVGVSPKAGEIGIEIEVEGNKFPKGAGYELTEGDRHKIPKTWKFTHDGSLRGDDNAEYVLAKPIKFGEVEKAVTDLWQMFSDYGSVLTESNRTSVHVHLNVQQWHLNRLCSFVAMYFVVEDLLTSWCGDHRVGNLFCLRGRDAPAIVRRLKEFFQRDGYGYQFSSGMHYAGLNPSAIHKFGSVEIRSLRGVNDPQVILDWVSVLERMYMISADFKDPREVVAGFSGNGPIAWLQNLLGDKYSTIVQNVPYSTDEIRDILYKGIRLAQDLCYCRDWSEYEEQKFEEDPFLRKSKVVMTTVSVESSAFLQSYGLDTVSAPSPIPASSYNIDDVLYTLQCLKENGQVSSGVYSALMSNPVDFIGSWITSQGFSIMEAETEDSDYEPDDDDYGFDEEDDE